MRTFLFFAVMLCLSCNNSSENKKTEKTDSSTITDCLPDKLDNPSAKDTVVSKPANDTVYTGGGNEPFWHIEVIKNKKISFLLADVGVPVDFPYKEPKTLFNKAIVYETSTGDKKLRLEIRKKECSDGMSNFVYPYSIFVSVNEMKYTGCAETPAEQAKEQF